MDFFLLRDLLPNIWFWFGSDLTQISELRLVNKSLRRAVDETFQVKDTRFGVEQRITIHTKKNNYPLRSVHVIEGNLLDILQITSLRKLFCEFNSEFDLIQSKDMHLFGKLEQIHLHHVLSYPTSINVESFLRNCKTLYLHSSFGYLHLSTINATTPCVLEDATLFNIKFDDPQWVLQSKKLHTIRFRCFTTYQDFLPYLKTKKDLNIEVPIYIPYQEEQFECESLVCAWPLKVCAENFVIKKGLSCYLDQDENIVQLLPRIKNLELVNFGCLQITIVSHMHLKKLELKGNAIETVVLNNLPNLTDLSLELSKQIQLNHLQSLESFQISGLGVLDFQLIMDESIPRQIRNLELHDLKTKPLAKILQMFPYPSHLLLNHCTINPCCLSKVESLAVRRSTVRGIVEVPQCRKLTVESYHDDDLSSYVPKNLHHLKSLEIFSVGKEKQYTLDFLPSLESLQQIKLTNVTKCFIPSRVNSKLQIDCVNSFVEFI